MLNINIFIILIYNKISDNINNINKIDILCDIKILILHSIDLTLIFLFSYYMYFIYIVLYIIKLLIIT